MNSEEVRKAVDAGYVQIGSKIYDLTPEVGSNRCDGCYFINGGCPSKAIDMCTVWHVTLQLQKKYNG